MQQDSKILRIVFWNVHRKDLTDFVCEIAESTMADVIILNENTVKSSETLRTLQENVSRDFYVPAASPSSKERFHCFCRKPLLNLSEVYSGYRTSIRKLKLGSHEILLALVHGVDPRNNDAETRQSDVQSLASDLSLIKEQQATNKLVILGDFNMNPYDRGMTLAAGLNAMMTRSCAARGSRTHQNKSYDFYYNPMWSLFGDNTAGPSGTVYDISNQGPYGWSMFDQVLIHHSIISLFHDVQILDQVGDLPLMDARGRPNSNQSSDHFPILVSFHGEQ
jgi:exonuclease III